MDIKYYIMLAIAAVFAACATSSKREIPYILDLEQSMAQLPADDYQKITGYLESRGCSLGVTRTFVGADLDECDDQCATYMKRLTSELSYDELDALHLRATTSFTYSAWRYLDPRHPDKKDPVTGFPQRVFIGKFTYPQPK